MTDTAVPTDVPSLINGMLDASTQTALDALKATLDDYPVNHAMIAILRANIESAFQLGVVYGVATIKQALEAEASGCDESQPDASPSE